MQNIQINISLGEGQFQIDSGDVSINYLNWMEDDKGVKLIGVILANEQNIEDAFSEVLANDELYMLKNIFNTAPLDQSILSHHIAFFKDNLEKIIKNHSNAKIIITFTDKARYNPDLVKLIENIVSKYKNVVIVKYPMLSTISLYNHLKIKYIYPSLILTHYLFEYLISLLVLNKNELNGAKRIILSNFRHYAADDDNNAFWGNFVKLLKVTTHEKPAIVYYMAPSSMSLEYYKKQLFDKDHTFLNNYISFKDFLINTNKYFRYRKYAKKKIKYIYDNVDYGKFVSPLIEFFFYIVFPITSKNRSILERFTRKQSFTLFSDSELNIVSLNLGFMKTDCKLVVLSNELIQDHYSAMPFIKGRKRPLFYKKIVYSEQTLKILQNKRNYPKDSMEIFPDPRFLNSIFDSANKAHKILFISQPFGSLDVIADKFNKLFKKSRMAHNFKLSFKPHPLEGVAITKGLDRDIKVLWDRKLKFSPEYAISKLSTLGLELLFDGSIVFFLCDKFFGIEKEIPFLICASEKEILDKILLLEQKPMLKKELTKKIEKFKLKEYGLDKKEVLLDKFKNIIKTL